MVRRLGYVVFAVVAAMGATAAPARDETRPFATAIADAIESCVDTSAIRFGSADRHAILDPADADAVRSAIVRRYPRIDEDGLAPQRVVLWRHPQFGWVYVALLVNPAKPGEVCFTASFGADRFELTPALIVKYFGASAAAN